MSQCVKIGIEKLGCIGTLPLLEFLLDERADRTDVDVRVLGSGSKLGLEQSKEITGLMIQQKPDLIVLIGPAQASPGPNEARRILASSGIPAIVISDGPTKKICKEIEDAGLGYIIVDADSMIGARREFLDPTEVALYNSDVIKVLAVTGALRLIVREIDKIIDSIKKCEKPKLPHLVVDGKNSMEAAEFMNSYAKAKAVAAHEIAKEVSRINSEACFKITEWEVYVQLVAAGHEMMAAAARLSQEAREIEKSRDTVFREPHFKDGKVGGKKALVEKPKKEADVQSS